MKLKCQQCLEKIASVPAGLPFKLAVDDIKEYECPTCLLFKFMSQLLIKNLLFIIKNTVTVSSDQFFF